MANFVTGLGARTLLVAAALSVAGCSSISDETLNSGSTSSTPGISVAPTVQLPAEVEVDVAAGSATTIPEAMPEQATTTVAAFADLAAGDETVDVVSAQLQDDDAQEQLPNTGTNETMLIIAIGCAMIVGGRTLIDLVNSAARAVQRIPARTRPTAPR